jgi:hypothetical protein
MSLSLSGCNRLPFRGVFRYLEVVPDEVQLGVFRPGKSTLAAFVTATSRFPAWIASERGFFAMAM